ncbi:MAG: matrixin family metalloprotease [Patescibacteria group bacterium]
MRQISSRGILLIFLLPILVLLGVILVPAGDGEAYTYGGYYWSGARAEFYNDIAGWDPNLITAPGDTWSFAGSPFRFVFKGNNVLYMGDGKNTVSRYYRSFDDVAKTYIVSRSGSVLTEVDLIINTKYDWGCCGEPDMYDVRNVTTHEFGHWLVLGDQYNDWDFFDTMYYTTYEGETRKRTLAGDDINGINYIY